jgi:hypothetical protein
MATAYEITVQRREFGQIVNYKINSLSGEVVLELEYYTGSDQDKKLKKMMGKRPLTLSVRRGEEGAEIDT